LKLLLKVCLLFVDEVVASPDPDCAVPVEESRSSVEVEPDGSALNAKGRLVAPAVPSAGAAGVGIGVATGTGGALLDCCELGVEQPRTARQTDRRQTMLRIRWILST
jgi:hypothetical protein